MATAPQVPQPPQPEVKDTAHQLGKAGLAAIPYAGGTLSELFGMLVGSPVEKRREEWFQTVAEVINEIGRRSQDVTPEALVSKLQNDEGFISTVIAAMRIHATTHQEDKRKALRNFLIHTGLTPDRDSDLHHILLARLDALTPSHIEILTFLESPKRAAEVRGIKFTGRETTSVGRVLEDSIPGMKGRRSWYDALIYDLNQMQLCTSSSYHAGGTSLGVLDQNYLTDLGKSLFALIKAEPTPGAPNPKWSDVFSVQPGPAMQPGPAPSPHPSPTGIPISLLTLEHSGSSTIVPGGGKVGLRLSNSGHLSAMVIQVTLNNKAVLLQAALPPGDRGFLDREIDLTGVERHAQSEYTITYRDSESHKYKVVIPGGTGDYWWRPDSGRFTVWRDDQLVLSSPS